MNIIMYIFIVALVFIWHCGIPVGVSIIPFSLILISYFFLLLILFKFKYFIKKLICIVKQTPVKYLIFFMIWVIFSSLFLKGLGGFVYIVRLIRDYILFVFPIVIFPIFIFPQKIGYKHLYKILIIIYSCIMIYGVFDLILQFIYPIGHKILYNIFCYGTLERENVLCRATSIFFEPSFFATFIFIFLPFIYDYSRMATNLFKHKRIDKILKGVIIVLSWINLIATLSPIYIIASLIYTVFYLRKIILKVITQKSFIFIFAIITVCLSSAFIYIDKISNKTLSRITSVISAKSINDIIEKEPSLGTRIVINVNTMIVALKHPIMGIGYASKESKEEVAKQVLNSPIGYTSENFYNAIGERGGTSPSIFYQTFCWTGFIGVFLLFLFFIKTIQCFSKVKKYYKEDLQLNICSLKYVCINYIIIFFYWSLMIDVSMWFIFGILNSFIYNYKINLNKRRIIIYENS